MNKTKATNKSPIKQTVVTASTETHGELHNVKTPADDVAAGARAVLEHNDEGTFTVPAHGLYPHQWLWDSCFIAIGQRHYDIDRAQLEILSLLRGQWSNGMLPHMLLHPGPHLSKKTYRKYDNVWRSWLNPNAPDNINTSGITQPPMLAESITRIGEKLTASQRHRWYKQIYPGLLAYHQWLYSERDPHHEGLVLQIHPWETGLDNTPPWMSELHEHLLPSWIRLMQSLKLIGVVGWFRADKKFVATHERLTNIEALALFDIQRRLRRKNYDFKRLIDHSLFAIEDLSFNCIFIRANSLLCDIANIINETPPQDLVSNMHKSEQALEELWDEYANEYFSRDFISHRLLKESSVATFLPLYAGCISKDKAAKLVSLLENDHRFGLNYPVPSVPLDSPWFDERRYWQGPTWININWLIIDGLQRYGYHDHAQSLRQSSLQLVRRSGFHEYFSPLDGRGAGTDNFSWTAALIIDLLHQ